jgi:hypothetical protein
MATAAATRTAPFNREEWAALKRCERTIHSWAEELCNGTIQEVENGIYHRFYNDRYGCPSIQGPRIADKSEKAMQRAQDIAKQHGFSVYEQGDPRGCALYVFRASDLKGRSIDECYSILARPVV